MRLNGFWLYFYAPANSCESIGAETSAVSSSMKIGYGGFVYGFYFWLFIAESLGWWPLFVTYFDSVGFLATWDLIADARGVTPVEGYAAETPSDGWGFNLERGFAGRCGLDAPK